MKEIRMVVTEKREFVSCDESKLGAQFGFFRTITNLIQGAQKTISDSNSPAQVIGVWVRPRWKKIRP